MKAQSPVQVTGNDNKLKPTASLSFCLDIGETTEGERLWVGNYRDSEA